MKTKFKLMLLCVMALLSSPVFAGGDSVGSVVNPLAEQGYIMFSAGTHNNKPACSTAGDRWAFDAKTPEGKSQQALLMLAYAQGKTVHVVGTGDCNDWADSERPEYFYLD